jgi:CRP-like cAMP-binding protein
MPTQRQPASGAALEHLDNEVLAALTGSALDSIRGSLRALDVVRHTVLFRADEPSRWVYFPSTAVVSYVVRLRNGSGIEAAVVGRDGMVGSVTPGFNVVPCEASVQIGGRIWRIRAETLRGIVEAPAVMAVFCRFESNLLHRCMQTIACNAFHPVEQRAIRWLLTISDLVGSPVIPVTHEVLATMLGVRRPTVTNVLRALDQSHLVAELRGRIIVRDRPAMLRASCECYRVMSRL